MPLLQRRLAAGVALLIFLIAAGLPYGWLVAHFGYDDVLRLPPAEILARFRAGGTPLVLAWLGFMLAALGFAAPALALDHLFAAAGGRRPLTLGFGLASALLQAIGLSRWVFVVPALARSHGDPATGEAGRAAIEAVFIAVHAYGGVAIGEVLGQLTLAAWTAGAAAGFLAMGGRWRLLALPGLASLPLWLAAQGEALATVLPMPSMPELAPFAFILWQAWLLVAGLGLAAGGFASGRRRRDSVAALHYPDRP